MNPSSAILVPSASPTLQKQLGIQVHWRLTGSIEKEVLHNALETILPKNCLPSKVGNARHLRRAFDALRQGRRRRQLVRQLGSQKHGFSLVEEIPEALDLEELEQTTDTDPLDSHEVKLTAKVLESGDLSITPKDHPLADDLRAEYEKQKLLYQCGTDLSTWLTTKVIPYCNGVSGRDRGGFYYIPAGEDVERFQKVNEVLSKVSVLTPSGRLVQGFKLYSVPVAFSESVLEAISDSIIEETDKLCDDIESKLKENSNMALRGLATQQARIINHEKKLKKYTQLLKTEFTDLSGRLQDLQTCLGVAQAKLEQNNG